MTTLQEQPQVQAGGPVAGQSSPGTGNSLTQISAGPAALAQLMIYETMALYAQIIKLQAEQKQKMIESQIDATEAQSAETIKAGKALLNWAIVSGATTFAFALGSAAASTIMTTKLNKEVNPKESAVTARTEPMEELEKSLSVEPTPEGAGRGKDFIGPKTRVEAQAEDRITEFKNGDYSKAKEDKTVTDKAIGDLKTDPEYGTWEDKFNAQLTRNKQTMNTYAQQKSQSANQVQTWTQIINSSGQSLSSVETGIGQWQQAKHNAAAGLAGTASQIAGSASQDAGTAMGKAGDAQNQEIQILEAIHRANSVN